MVLGTGRPDFREIFVARDPNRWEGPSVQYQLDLLGTYVNEAGEVVEARTACVAPLVYFGGAYRRLASA